MFTSWKGLLKGAVNFGQMVLHVTSFPDWHDCTTDQIHTFLQKVLWEKKTTLFLTHENCMLLSLIEMATCCSRGCYHVLRQHWLVKLDSSVTVWLTTKGGGTFMDLIRYKLKFEFQVLNQIWLLLIFSKHWRATWNELTSDVLEIPDVQFVLRITLSYCCINFTWRQQLRQKF